jgi:Flp pilus assembly protein TadD
MAAMQPVEPPDAHHLRAAQGWLELGDHRESLVELDRISPEFRNHPEVLAARWSALAAVKDWEACVEAANLLVQAAPESLAGWIDRSYSLHELKRTTEAAALLHPAVELFPKAWLVRYNLACYASQLGNLTEAWDWLQSAIELGDTKEVVAMALEDRDLAPIREKVVARKRREA